MRVVTVLLALLALLVLTGAAGPAAAADWPGFRGPAHDGAVREATLFAGEARGLTIGWSREIGPGYSAVAVADGRVVTMFAAGDDDVVAAFDADTGEELWRAAVGPTYAGHDGSHDGPISTPLVVGGRVFALGPRGVLLAVDAADGREAWRVDLVATHGAKKPYYGFTTSPVLLDGTLVVQIGAEEGPAVVGLDPADGARRWAAGSDVIEYHSPIVAELGGVRQVVAAGQKRIYGIAAADGRVLWQHEHDGDDRAMGGMTVVPVPAGDGRLFVMGKIDASTMLRVTRDGEAWRVETLWTTTGLKQSYVTPVYHDGRLYGMSNRILVCLDAATGEVVWRSREPGDGFPILVGGMLVMTTKPGSLHVAPASAEGWSEVASITPFEEHSWSEPAFAGGHLFARSMARLVRIDPAAPAEAGAGERGDARSAFERYLAELGEAPEPERPALVDAWLATQPSFPVVDAATSTASFVWRGEATDVGIVGDMIGFRREDPMHRVAGTDLFHATIALEPDAAVSYGFIVDYGEPIADPRNPRTAEGVFGEVSWFAMPAWRVRELPDVELHRGRLESFEWESAAFEGATRRASVYLPAGYGADEARRYPTLYVLDGGDALAAGSVDRVLDALIADEEIRPAVVVFVEATEDENGRDDLRSRDEYLTLLVDELIPTVDSRYATRPETAWRGVVGSGRAANLAFYAAFSRGDVFGRLGAQAPTLRAGDVFDGERGTPPLVIYMDWGTYHLRSPHEAWDLARESRALWAALRDSGYRPSGGERPVGLGWFAWRGTVDAMLRALLPR